MAGQFTHLGPLGAVLKAGLAYLNRSLMKSVKLWDYIFDPMGMFLSLIR